MDCPIVPSLSRVLLFATPWTAASQASLSYTISLSLPNLMSIEWVMPSNHLLLCHSLLLLPSVFPSIRVFFNDSALHLRWPKYWSFSISIHPIALFLPLIELALFQPLAIWRQAAPLPPQGGMGPNLSGKAPHGAEPRKAPSHV